MSDLNPDPVVVAVGYDAVESALAYAVEEAARLGCGLHLVHAVHIVPTGPELPLVDAVDVERIGRETLTAATEEVRRLAGDGVTVTGQVVHGSPVHAIVGAVPDARVIVLQRRPLSRLRRVVSRSVSERGRRPRARARGLGAGGMDPRGRRDRSRRHRRGGRP